MKVIALEEGVWGVWSHTLSSHPSCQLFCKKLRRMARASKAKRYWQETGSLSHFLSVLLKTFTLFFSISNLQRFLPCPLSYHLPLWIILLSGLNAFLSLGPAPLWHSPLISSLLSPSYFLLDVSTALLVSPTFCHQINTEEETLSQVITKKQFGQVLCKQMFPTPNFFTDKPSIGCKSKSFPVTAQIKVFALRVLVTFLQTSKQVWQPCLFLSGSPSTATLVQGFFPQLWACWANSYNFLRTEQ